MKTLCLISGIIAYIMGVIGAFLIVPGTASWLVLVAGLAAGSILLGLWKVISLLEKKE